ncbi:DUF1579 domain-containing protein [Flaviaesturariibacter amylovorans]|uniref:DUF1579 domain-containing protein n=1 Tax=Flaviaesturariibacter amylovorans TaxID=1084520 RepID=A0ABP8GHR5_9BACT
MKKMILPLFALAALASCQEEKKPAEAPVVAAANTENKTEAPAPAKAMPDQATMEKNWKDYMTPGTEHGLLAEAKGDWVGEMKMWQAPGAPPDSSTIQQENRMLLGGRYQQSIAKGNVMTMPFEGISTVGFDNHKKKYVSTWIDNMGTGVMNMEGSWDATTKTINFTGKMINPATKAEEDVRETFTILDKDHHLMTMYGTGPDGKEFKTMQIHYTRKK